jgi:hypothetical protein
MGGKIPCHHLQILILGIIYEESRINRQKNRKIHKQNRPCRKKETAAVLRTGFLPLGTFQVGCPAAYWTWVFDFPLQKPVPEIPHSQCNENRQCQYANPHFPLRKRNPPCEIKLCAENHADAEKKTEQKRKEPLSAFPLKAGLQNPICQSPKCQKEKHGHNAVGIPKPVPGNRKHPAKPTDYRKGQKRRHCHPPSSGCFQICTYALVSFPHPLFFSPLSSPVSHTEENYS